MTTEHLTDFEIQEMVFDGKNPSEAWGSHISVCRSCAQKLRSYQELMNPLGQMLPSSISVDVREAVINRIKGHDQQTSSFVDYVIVALLASASCLVVFAFYVVVVQYLRLMAPYSTIITFLIMPLSIMLFSLISYSTIKKFSKKMKCLDNSFAECNLLMSEMSNH